MSRRTRLTPLGRLLVLVVILLLGAIAGAAGATATRPHAQAWSCVTARPGDTLWDMASGAEGDRREAVHRIVTENDLATTPIRAGQALWVPVELASGLTPAAEGACPTPG